MSRKSEIITFKADASLLDAIKGIGNRSQFIREAILSALESVCPLCQGTGTLTMNQRQHWQTFAQSHAVSECDSCHEAYLICESEHRRGYGKRQHE